MSEITTQFSIPTSLTLPTLSDSIDSFTGEDVRIPRLEVPQISISYKDEDDVARAEGEKKGEFVQYEASLKERKALGKNITIQILHHRQSLSSYAEKDGVTRSMYTPEVSMKADDLSLFESTSSGDGKRSTKFVMKGSMKKLRETFPDLGYRKNLYVIHDGQLKSLLVKGASFGQLIDFTKALAGKSSSSVLVELGTTKGKKGTVTYYATTFTVVGQSDVGPVKVIGTQLSEWFAKHDKLQQDSQVARSESAAETRGDAPVQASAARAASTPNAAAVAPTSAEIADELNLDGADTEQAKPTEADLQKAGLL